MDFRPVIPPVTVRAPKSLGTISDVVSINFSVTTILLIGALIQTTLFLLPIPKLLTLTPALAILLSRFVSAMCVTYGYMPNPYLKNVALGKTTMQLPDREARYGKEAGGQKIAVLLLGAKSNHPLGTFAPDFKTVGLYLKDMTDELEGDMGQESGFLGQTSFNRRDANGATELLLISYWRSLEDVHRYGHGPTHLKAWKWWESTIKSHNYIGFMHEVYEADRGMYESLYVNFQPTLAGATTVLRRNDGGLVAGDVPDEWVSPLVEAKGKLRSSNGRRGLRDGEKVASMFKNDVYAS